MFLSSTNNHRQLSTTITHHHHYHNSSLLHHHNTPPPREVTLTHCYHHTHTHTHTQSPPSTHLSAIISPLSLPYILTNTPHFSLTYYLFFLFQTWRPYLSSVPHYLHSGTRPARNTHPTTIYNLISQIFKRNA